MTPDDYCQQKALRPGSSLYYSLLFLAPAKRCAMYALYAFRQELADVVDQTTDQNAARIKLAWWRHEVAELYKGNAQHLVTRALAQAMPNHAIAQERLDEMIDGREMDLLQSRYHDFAGLKRYCTLVGGAVQLGAAGILGASQPASQPASHAYASNLGLACELARIIRCVGEDARRGRVYLPVDELQRFGVPIADILNARYSDGFARLMQFQYERSLGHFETALAVLPEADRKAQRPSLIIAALYRALLEEIRADGFRVLHQRTSLTPIRKLWQAWKTWVRA